MKKIITLIILSVSIIACANGDKKLTIFAGNSIHYWGDHEQKIFAEILADGIFKAYENVDVEILEMDKGDKLIQAKDSDAVIIIAEGEDNHPLNKEANALEELNNAGVNIGILHYALMPNDNTHQDSLLKVIGGYYKPFYSVHPFWQADCKLNKNSSISRGVKEFSLHDEIYFNIFFKDESKIERILSATPTDKARSGRFGRNSGNEIVKSNLGKEETLMWIYNAPNGTKNMGLTMGHSVWHLMNDNYRKLLLNTCAYLSDLEIPKDGINSIRPTIKQIESKITKPKRRDYKNYIKKINEVEYLN